MGGNAPQRPRGQAGSDSHKKSPTLHIRVVLFTHARRNLGTRSPTIVYKFPFKYGLYLLCEAIYCVGDVIFGLVGTRQCDLMGRMMGLLLLIK